MKISENPKNSLKSFGLPSKNASQSTICLEKDRTLSFDSKTNAKVFKDFYSNLASDLLKKHPFPSNNSGKNQFENITKTSV